jgi:alkylation response protein AidB-like acyl-CoA dehydrogenase
VHFAFTEEQLMIASAVREMARRAGTLARAHAAPGDAYDRNLWQALAGAGYAGILVPEEFGGVALGLVEVGCVLQHLGEGLASVPFLGTAVLTAELIKRLERTKAFGDLLAGIAAGKTVTCTLLSHGVPRVFVDIREGRRMISGSFGPVPHAAGVDSFLVHAVERATGKEHYFHLPAGANGVSVEQITGLDQSRPIHCVQLHEVECGDAEHIGSSSPGLAQYLAAIAAAGLAAEMYGGACQVHRLACDYAREREQFGQPIGRFQAIKHLLADGRVMLDGLHSILYAALWHLGAGTDSARAFAAAAKAVASDAYGRVAGDAIQVYGAMGFAAETDPHLYLKRSQTDRVLYGTASEHLQFWLNDYCDRTAEMAQPA